MRKAMRHTGVLMMLAVLALGLVGAAYTLWFEKLTVTATVETGILDVDLSCVNPEMPYTYDNNDLDEGAECAALAGQAGTTIIGKQLSNGFFDFKPAAYWNKPPLDCRAVLSDTGSQPNGENPANWNKLDLKVSGAYPFAGCQFYFDIHNDGSVPVHLEYRFTQSANSAGNLALFFNGCYGGYIPNPNGDHLGGPTEAEVEGTSLDSVTAEDLDAATHPPVVNPWIPLRYQLHTSDELVCQITVFPVQSAKENQTGSNAYSATFEFVGYQWNEDFHDHNVHGAANTNP